MFPTFEESSSVFPGVPDDRSDTYSVTICDVDGNGLPDIYINNHSQRSQTLFLQIDTNLFESISTKFSRDFHGAFWADFDGDGQLELLQTVGGGYGTGNDEVRFSNLLLDLSDGSLNVSSNDLGLDMPLARARQVVPYDFDNDGNLDVFHGSLPRSDGQQSSTVLMGVEGSDYRADEDALGGDISRTWAIMPGRFETGDSIQFLGWDWWSRLDYFSLESNKSGYEVYESDHRIDDLVVEDFNGDLLSDAVIVSGASETNDVTQADDDSIRFHLRYPGKERLEGQDSLWIEFETDSAFTLSLKKQSENGPPPIYIGGDSIAADSKNVTLDPSDPAVIGRPEILDTAEEGVIGVWMDPDTGVWRIEFAGEKGFRVLGSIEATGSFTNMTTSDLPEVETYTALLTSDGSGGFDEERLPTTDPLIALTAGDFDNDGDVDIFGLASTSTEKLQNVFFINDGSGNFSVLEGEEYAAGETTGVGASAWTTDLDRDGWLDIFTATNQRDTSTGEVGSYEYFHNTGGDNSWLLVDIAASNSAVAYGSIIEIETASGAQMRVYDGGVRHMGQEDPIVHFGLGTNEAIDSLSITWRDGRTYVEYDLPANTIIAAWRGDEGNNERFGTDDLDIMYGEAGEDLLSGGFGDDRLNGGDGADELWGGDGNDTLRGKSKSDIAFGESGEDVLLGGFGDDQLYGGEGKDRLYGLEDDDLLMGNSGRDLLWGGLGRDKMYGGTANDKLYGGDGDDLLKGGAGADELVGGKGNDRLYGGDGGDTGFGKTGADELYGADGNDTLRGNRGNDLILGETGEDTLIGGLGDDQLYGGKDNDRLYGRREDDLLVGNSGRDELRGGLGGDQLYGGTGGDKLYGGEGDDLLKGGKGADVLVGGAGDDILEGGAGADRFVITAGDGSTDIILDFEDGIDRLDMRGSGVEFADLNIVEEPNGSLTVEVGDEDVFILSASSGIRAGDISSDDFIFI